LVARVKRRKRLLNGHGLQGKGLLFFSLHIRLQKLQKDQLQLTRETEDKRLEAEAARKKVIWLESPFHPENLWTWLTTRGPRILLVIGVSGLLLYVLRLSVHRVARTVVRKSRGARVTGTKRADTLALSFRSAASVLIIILTILLVFQEAGVDIKTVLGGGQPFWVSPLPSVPRI